MKVEELRSLLDPLPGDSLVVIVYRDSEMSRAITKFEHEDDSHGSPVVRIYAEGWDQDGPR